MSGTSLDAIDAALFEFRDNSFIQLNALETALPKTLRQQLVDLCQPGDNEIDRMGIADRMLGHEFANAALALLNQAGKSADQIAAIGSHGQTIRHRPSGQTGFTLQIGDPNTIAYETGITTVADFRRKDIAAGGQGAPLAPIFHQAVFSSPKHNRVILNIGGIANITSLARSGEVLGFDTGPGNGLMDAWIEKQRGEKFDRDGQWAASANPIDELLATLLAHPYLQQSIPKSTGREDFNLSWLMTLTEDKKYCADAVQATLLEFTCRTIASEIEKLAAPAEEVFVCGGGAYNTELMGRLATLLQSCAVKNTQCLGIAPQWVEAAAFAWLAKQALEFKPSAQAAITGARRDLVLGSIHLPH